VWNDLGVIIMGQFKLYNASGPYGKLTGGPNGEMTENHACFPGLLLLPHASMHACMYVVVAFISSR
jgi:hypothetical protein